MIYIGIDNGVTGSIAIITNRSVHVFHTPVKKALNYTKTQAFLHRIDTVALNSVWQRILPNNDEVIKGEVRCLVERPLVNPLRWVASMSAMRALEATLVFLEQWCIPYEYIDSREWQSVLLPAPNPIKGNFSKAKKREMQHAALKAMSLLRGKQLFPKIDFTGFTDADGLLIAEYCRRKYK